ncbi:Gfo/Idh/MocA family oxidoreductase [Maribacter polysiphoniae]|uniref:Gfo/Idh/MocA family oxidoreductase n=1 Tax=Maribacter polysiphoniae TaxID=429344 RepID=A0A316E0Z3_9FLAO|nr:Gfo/Idh/MocA family oxidoreductase [Maribacter polysiphoniae]MBD1260994.1 Gfo/Idh/MocA family oxidoreductase [Maribacter polysiphoniae]PWK23765.1 putative dehydrogenase [Maribacter polysiphoniae]
MKKKITRRKFIKKGSAGLVGASMLSTSALSYGRILGSNDAIQMAVIGIRGRGGTHIDNFGKMKNVRLKYLVDVDENLFKERLDQVEELGGYRPKTEWDMRRVFDDNEIDAVSVATPNHWHALSTIWAAQAGKHVYVEKPSSHNVFEGRKMIEASRKHNVLVQVGYQNRSIDSTIRAMKFIRDGKLGEVYMTRGLCFKPRANIGQYPDGAMKTGEKFRMNLESGSYETPYTQPYLDKVHYDMWLGPAPKRTFNRNRFHYNWHWHWDYGNGDTGNQGPHQFDVARWALGKDELPVRVNSMGGYYGYNSSQETPNSQTSLFEYEDGKILEFGTRGLTTNPEGVLLPNIQLTGDGKISATTNATPVKIGTIVLGTEGWMQIDAGGNWQTFFGRKNEAGPTSGEKDDSYDPLDLTGSGGGDAIFDNFISAVRNNDRSELTCDIETGHQSTVLPLIANVAYRLGRELRIDGNQESFVKDKEANKMLTREYRKGFTVPDVV